MSETRQRQKGPAGDESAPLPGWLCDENFSSGERKAYQEAAQRLGFEVSDWARSVLNQAARAALGRKRDTRRAPRSLGAIPRNPGHA